MRFSYETCPNCLTLFVNPRPVALLLPRLGFEKLAVTTPGKLDIDILVNDRFWKTFVATATEAEKSCLAGDDRCNRVEFAHDGGVPQPMKEKQVKSRCWRDGAKNADVRHAAE